MLQIGGIIHGEIGRSNFRKGIREAVPCKETSGSGIGVLRIITDIACYGPIRMLSKTMYLIQHLIGIGVGIILIREESPLTYTAFYYIS